MLHGNTRKPSSTLGSHLRGLLHFASHVLQVRLFGLLSCLLDCVFSHWPHAPSSGLLYYAYFTEVWSFGIPEKPGCCCAKQHWPQHLEWTLSARCRSWEKAQFQIDEGLAIEILRIFFNGVKVATMQYHIHSVDVLWWFCQHIKHFTFEVIFHYDFSRPGVEPAVLTSHRLELTAAAVQKALKHLGNKNGTSHTVSTQHTSQHNTN